MKFLKIITPKIITLVLFYYMAFYLYWEINGIEIIRYNGLCHEYKSNQDTNIVIKSDSYIVNGFHHTNQIEKQLDDYACLIADSLLVKYDVVIISYYKYSRITNNKHYEKYNDDTYSDVYDYLWDYSFHKIDSTIVKRRISHNFKEIKFYYPKPKC
jgi:hypothetical protein